MRRALCRRIYYPQFPETYFPEPVGVQEMIDVNQCLQEEIQRKHRLFLLREMYLGVVDES
jgi:hypothetical protein